MLALTCRPEETDRLVAEHWERAPERDWVALAQSQWEPLLVGARFFLAPEWREDPTPPGRLRLAVRPGRACGAVRHPATRLCKQIKDSCRA
ncbi:MAG: 50S ribosomal protein L11 methyltransferase [Acidobacteriota bacterium]